VGVEEEEEIGLGGRGAAEMTFNVEKLSSIA